jgi:hypothetical protein
MQMELSCVYFFKMLSYASNAVALSETEISETFLKVSSIEGFNEFVAKGVS